MNLKSVPAELSNYIKYIETISNYIKFKSDNGVLTVSVNLPDKVYAAYAAALVVSGHVEKDDINGMKQAVAAGFLKDYLDAITGSEMDLVTFTNTINKH